MPQSLVKNYVHIVFSTKHRYPFLKEPAIREELFSYIGGICKNNECYPICVGGYIDHIHVLCLLSRKMALMDLIQEVKTHASKWVKTKGVIYHQFYWQHGYASFSVNQSQINRVKNYILTQEEHHAKVYFQDEYLSFLKKSEIEYDKQYVWD